MSSESSTSCSLNALQKLATFVSEKDFHLTPDSQVSIRDALIDTLGCIVVGMKEDSAAKALLGVQDWGMGSSTVFGTGITLAAPWAAFVNATAGHSLDFDDWESPGNTHISVVLIPALLAVASTKETSGRDILIAYAAGFEVIARLGEAMNFDHYAMGWHSTATLGAIGAAASVAKLLGLTAEETANALSIASSQASGYTCQFGSDAKPLQAGFAAKSGVFAAKLAKSGLNGQTHVFDAPNGLKTLMSHGDTQRFNRPFEEFPWETLAIDQYGLAVKAYPCCGYTHRLIDCAIQIRKNSEFDPMEVKSVTASLPDFHSNILPFQQPANRSEALFSAPFCIAVTLLGRIPTLLEIHRRAWEEPVVKELISKVTKVARVPANPALNYDAIDPDWVEVLMNDGTVHRAEVAFPLGAPENRMSSEQIMDKFMLNAKIASNLKSNSPESFYLNVTSLLKWTDSEDINILLDEVNNSFIIPAQP
ncbi:MAG: hypothetical protein GKR95_21785 [Gammaproteobacteria bacterium]|nr:hypothetical protein [Gammaproteobacteria bacterium]